VGGLVPGFPGCGRGGGFPGFPGLGRLIGRVPGFGRAPGLGLLPGLGRAAGCCGRGAGWGRAAGCWGRAAPFPPGLAAGLAPGAGLVCGDPCGCPCGRSCACNAGGSVAARQQKRRPCNSREDRVSIAIIPSQVFGERRKRMPILGETQRPALDLMGLDAVFWPPEVAVRNDGWDRLISAISGWTQ
jgi:hypothetical protein